MVVKRGKRGERGWPVHFDPLEIGKPMGHRLLDSPSTQSNHPATPTPSLVHRGYAPKSVPYVFGVLQLTQQSRHTNKSSAEKWDTSDMALVR